MSKRDGGKPSVVLVDDEPDFLKIAAQWLEGEYDVASFSGGDGLLDKLEPLAPDVIVLDVIMPPPDGCAVCRQVRADPRFESVPVIFLTGADSDADFLRQLDAGGSRFLTKPIQAETLRQAIAEELA